MTDPSSPNLKDQLTAPLVEDRDPIFAAPLDQRVKRERRKGVLAIFLWRAAIVASVGLLAAAGLVGGFHIARLATKVILGG